MRVSPICGLIGVIGDSDFTDKKVFDLLLKLDTTRGKHSTGVARVPWNGDKRKDVEIVKGIGTPWDLIERKPNLYYNDYVGTPGPYIQGNYIALMGHNRWATVGEIIDENAHPFEAGKIIGMQNGTLPQSSINKLDDHEFYDTDTEALMFNIDLHGIENVIPKITGAWALTWYNREEDSFNILRNKERPLHFAWKKNKKVMYYASEAWMLYAAFDKFDVDLYEDDKGDSVWQFLSNTHYKFAFPKHGALFNKDNAWVKSELKGFTPPPVQYESNYSSYFSPTTTTKSAKDSANVFRGKSTASSSQSVEYWVEHRDKFVEFTVDGTWAKDEQGKSYIYGETVHDGAEVRVYPSAKHPNLEFDLGNPQVNSFAARIKKIKVVAGKRFYLTIDYDTLTEATYNGLKYGKTNTTDRPSDKDMDDDIPWERIFPLSMGGDKLDEYEALRSIERGCCWCSYTPHLHEIPNIEWIKGSSEFLCEDCASNPEVKQYMAEYVPA